MSETHIPGQTTRTAQRAAEDFTQPVHHLDLDEDCASLLEEASSNPSHRAAKTLSKDSSMSVAIIGGAEVRDHSAYGSALIPTLRGYVSLSVNDTEVDLPVGQGQPGAHRLSATVDSVVLLVVGGEK